MPRESDGDNEEAVARMRVAIVAPDRGGCAASRERRVWKGISMEGKGDLGMDGVET